MDGKTRFSGNFVPQEHLVAALQVAADQSVPAIASDLSIGMDAYKRKSTSSGDESSTESTKRLRPRSDDVSIEELREKNEARLLRNRLSAKQSRERKKSFISTL
jgi:hypothetical protein